MNIFPKHFYLNTAAASEAPGAGGDIAPVRQGGEALSLDTGADAIGELGLLDDELGAPSDTDNTRNDDDVNADATDGDQDIDDPEGADEDLQSADTDTDDEPGEDTDETDEQEPISSLADLAEALEVDSDVLDNFTDTFKASGEEITVTLQELRAGYQKDADYRRQTQALAETRRAFDAEQATRAQEHEAKLAQVGQVLVQSQNILIGEVDSAEMQELRRTNPAEWTARREELQQRINGVKQLFVSASQQFDQLQAQQTEQRQQHMQQTRTQEIEKLTSAIPDWSDDKRQQIFGYLQSTYDYQPTELNGILDSRQVIISEKARLYDEMMAVQAKTKKTVKKAVPRTQKAGGTKQVSKASKGVVNTRKAKAQLRKSGSLKDAAALIDLTIKDI